MSITAKIIADSISPDGIRITTMELEYPRFIHAEFMTHRALSRNSSSSRAIPFKRLLKMIRTNPAMPVHWGANQPGMQASRELSGWRRNVAKLGWLGGMWATTGIAQMLNCVGVHKQVVNRMVEPWSHIRVIVTATSWENFFHLRLHPDAQPEIMVLAAEMVKALEGSEPQPLAHGEWHLPYITDDDRVLAEIRSDIGLPPLELLKRMSAARCARVSYLTHDGKAPVVSDDLALYDRLAGSQPIHASPLEHQATPAEFASGYGDYPLVAQPCRNRKYFGNFFGWAQHRKMNEGEHKYEKWELL